MEADKSGFFKETQQMVESYIRERLLLLKFQTAARSATIVSSLLVGLCIGLLSFLILMLLTVTAVVFFTALTGKWYGGLLILTAFYLLVLVVVYVNRNTLKKSFSDMIVSLFFLDDNSSPTDNDKVQ